LKLTDKFMCEEKLENKHYCYNPFIVGFL